MLAINIAMQITITTKSHLLQHYQIRKKFYEGIEGGMVVMGWRLDMIISKRYSPTIIIL